MTIQEYTDYRYIYPPRAECKIKPSSLPVFDNLSFFAQPKYNGCCVVVFIDPEGKFYIRDRENGILTLQRPIHYNHLVDPGHWTVFAGEYLNKNKKGEDGNPFNHKFIIWDILVYKSKWLIGSSFEERYDLLKGMYGQYSSKLLFNELWVFNHLFITDVKDVFLAPCYSSDFANLYTDIIKTDLYEGLVLKRRNAKLEIGLNSSNNSLWQLKCRKETKSYSF
jgi:hypothetical protein